MIIATAVEQWIERSLNVVFSAPFEQYYSADRGFVYFPLLQPDLSTLTVEFTGSPDGVLYFYYPRIRVIKFSDTLGDVTQTIKVRCE